MNAPEVPSSGEPSAPVETSTGLLRVLGPGMAMAMVIGDVIGAGIFLMPSMAVQAAGQFSTVFAAWVTGGVISILGALCIAELGVMLPQAGGLYVYLREAYGKAVAFMFCWTEFGFGRPASIGALATGIVMIWGEIVKRNYSNWESALIASLVIAGLTAVNVLGVIWGGRVQGGTTLIKTGFLFVLTLLPLGVMLLGETGIVWENYSTRIEPRQVTWTSQFAMALIPVLWAYMGWHSVTPVAEEIRNPQRNIPLALFGGLTILIVLYLGANLAYHGVLTMSEIQAAGLALPQKMVEKLLAPLSTNLAAGGVLMISIVTVFSILGSMNANLMNGPRVLFAMAQDQPFFHSVSRVHPRFHTPWLAILIQGGMSVVMISISAILVELDLEILRGQSVLDLLTDYVIFSATLFLMLSVAAVVVLRRKHPTWNRSYRTWGYPLVPAAYLIVNSWFLWKFAERQLLGSLIMLGLSLVALPLYGLQRRLAH